MKMGIEVCLVYKKESQKYINQTFMQNDVTELTSRNALSNRRSWGRNELESGLGFLFQPSVGLACKLRRTQINNLVV